MSNDKRDTLPCPPDSESTRPTVPAPPPSDEIEVTVETDDVEAEVDAMFTALELELAERVIDDVPSTLRSTVLSRATERAERRRYYET